MSGGLLSSGGGGPRVLAGRESPQRSQAHPRDRQQRTRPPCRPAVGAREAALVTKNTQ